MKKEEIKELKETLSFATIHENIIKPKTADQLQRYISQLEADKLEMAKAIVELDWVPANTGSEAYEKAIEYLGERSERD